MTVTASRPPRTLATHPIDDLLDLLRAIDAGKVHRSQESGVLIRRGRQFNRRVETKANALAGAGLIDLETLALTSLGRASLEAGRIVVSGTHDVPERVAAEPVSNPADSTARTWPERQPHQVRALRAVADAFSQSSRAQLHWACGTGKTFVGRWLAEDFGAALSVVFVPSLALIAQALAEWQSASDWPFEAVVVCSDRTAADSWRVEPGWWAAHGVQVTTDDAPVTTWLNRPLGALPRVVFSTYHSAPVVARAARRARVRFDLMVCDEAHRLAGRPDERFRAVLEDGFGGIPARKRLFATATPIYADRSGGLLSMDDIAVFDPVADRLDFAQAIEQGLLVDYQVLVLDAGGGARREEPESLGTTTPAAVLAAAREGVTRLITFHSRVATARQFAGAIDGVALPDGRTVRAAAVAGTDPAARRHEVLAGLAESAPDQLSVVSNARCLTEGVNVPAVDGVVFADPRTSDTDIIQAIGRALRPAPSKTRGLIVLPVCVPEGDEAERLEGGEFATVWAVLRALRSLDPRMAAVLDRPKPYGSRGHLGDPLGHDSGGLVRFETDRLDLSAFVGRFVEPVDDDAAWDTMLDRVAKWVADHGHAAIPVRAVSGGARIDLWVSAQRRVYALGALRPDRAGRLVAIPGWGWTAEAARWFADFEVVKACAVRGLDLIDPDIATAPLDRRDRRAKTRTVGQWCAWQRKAYRDGDLDEMFAGRCEEIPGWTWEAGLSANEQHLVDALGRWVDEHRDANVPPGVTSGSLRLGDFVVALRRAKVTGRLPQALADEVAAVTPARSVPGALEWRADETRWELHLLALRQFAERTGGCAIPEHGTEERGGSTFRIYEWATRQRYFYRHGRLDEERAVQLERIPGWTWERSPLPRVTVEVGARQHGTRMAYAAGCRCAPCTKANRSYETERQRLRDAGQATTDLVDTAPVRGHLRVLEAQVGKRARPAMRAITGFNKKTIDETINGQRSRMHPEFAEALLALTAEGLQSHIEANPNSADEVPAGPTLELIDDLTRRGWPASWINRELGGTGPLQIAKTGSGLIKRSKAEAIAALHDRIGDRVAPRLWHAAVPPLDDILAAEQAAGPGSPALERAA
jgi:superfamily II DNA or RNA helicase